VCMDESQSSAPEWEGWETIELPDGMTPEMLSAALKIIQHYEFETDDRQPHELAISLFRAFRCT
jgi:hypothetical protein